VTENMVVPDIGGAGEVDVIEILVKPGDHIEVDTPVVTLESDKATMDVPSTAAGVVKELKVHVGDRITQGAVILTMDKTSGNGIAKTAADKPAKPAIPVAPVAPVVPKPPAASAPSSVSSSAEIHAGPAVRKLARELGVDLQEVAASGPKSRILKEDIEQFVKTRLAQFKTGGGGGGFSLPAMPAVDFAAFGAVETQPLTRLKKLSGKNLQRNWILAPHVTQMGEADITVLEDYRLKQKVLLEKQNIRLTPIVFVMKAVVAALKKFPQFNASLDPSGENLVLKKYFHIGVAVDTPEGLVVPVIRDVDKKGLADLARELGEISEKARQKKLLPSDMQGGCFTISSLGGIGGSAFTPVINLPEVAILGVSKSVMKPVYCEGAFVPRLMMPLSLSYDHRVIDGADGARFMVYLTELLSDIRHLLL